jgi:uncharacterized protein
VIREEPGAVVVEVLVVPRASKEKIGPVVGDRLKVSVTAPPVDGEANAAVCRALAAGLGIAKGRVSIARGDGSRRKSVRIEGVTRRQVEEAWISSSSGS